MNLLNLHMDVEETEELTLQLLNLTHQYSTLYILMYFIEKYNLTLNINAIMLDVIALKLQCSNNMDKFVLAEQIFDRYRADILTDLVEVVY